MKGRTEKSEDERAFSAAFFANVGEVLKDTGLQWVQLEEKAGFNKLLLINMKNRGGSPSIFQASKIADALEVSLDALCGREPLETLRDTEEYLEVIREFANDLRQQIGITGGKLFGGGGE